MRLKIEDRDDCNETHMLHEIARQVRVCFDRRAQHLGLTRSQWYSLAIMRRNPGLRQSQLAELMEIEPITLVRQLDRMEKNGWIERRPDPSDRRANLLYLTEKTTSIIGDMRVVALQVRKDVLEGFSQEEHATLLSYLQRIKNNVAGMLCGETGNAPCKKD